MRRYLAFLFWVTLVMVGCKPEPLLMSMDTMDFNWTQQYIDPTDPIRIRINASSSSSTIRRVTLKSYDPKGLQQVLLDSLLQDPLKSFSMEYIYMVPHFEDTTCVHITGSVLATDGESGEMQIRLYVLPHAQSLATLDGITLYSGLSYNKSGFSFPELKTIYPDSTRTNFLTFYDLPQRDSLIMDDLSCTWYSTSGLYFARAESFNYGEATQLSLEQSYSNSVKDNIIQHIKNDDIILVGSKTKALGAIKVLLVDDPIGVLNDRYVFSLKYIK